MIYEELKYEFERLTKDDNSDYQEVLGFNKNYIFNDLEALNNYKNTLPPLYETLGRPKTYEEKLFQEEAHYGKLKYTLLHQIAESKFYMKEQVLKSRKILVLSTDCISTLQIIFREGKIFVGVYFRSSHLTELLPVDITFILGLVQETIDYLESRINEPSFEDVAAALPIIKASKIEISLSFGSLHKY